MSTSHRGLRICIALALTLAAAACVPIPIPSGPVQGSRQNFGDSVPSTIVKGQSTREDVLFALGEPDRRGNDDRWFAYASARRLGGVALWPINPYPIVLAWHETTRHRVVIVQFDLQGVVTDARFAERVCGEWTLLNDESYPCVDLALGAEPVVQIDRLDARATLPVEAGERLRDNFVAAMCRRDDRWIDGAAFVTDRAVYFLDRAAEGEPVSRLVFRWTTHEIAAIEWGKFDSTAGNDTVRVRHSDGSVVLLAFKRLPSAGSGEPATFDRARAARFIATVQLVKDPSAQ